MNSIQNFHALARRLSDASAIRPDDVLSLRRLIFQDGVVDDEQAQTLFRLNDNCTDKCDEWFGLYVEALTDYFVWQSTPRGYVSDEQASQLIAAISQDGHIDDASELALLINIVHWCTHCPDQLGQLAISAVRDSVLHTDHSCYGSNRPPAVILNEDVELIRSTIYAPGSPGGFTVSRDEAERLLELDRKTSADENADSWPDLLAKGVANYLMFPRGAPIVPEPNEALRREEWLKERGTIGEIFTQAGQALASGNIPLREVLSDLDPFWRKKEAEAAARETARLQEAVQREAITHDEATWLIAQIEKAPVLSEGVLQLLKIIKTNSPNVDPVLDPLLQKAA